jgi:hypothetical protein
MSINSLKGTGSKAAVISRASLEDDRPMVSGKDQGASKASGETKSKKSSRSDESKNDIVATFGSDGSLEAGLHNAVFFDDTFDNLDSEGHIISGNPDDPFSDEIRGGGSSGSGSVSSKLMKTIEKDLKNSGDELNRHEIDDAIEDAIDAGFDEDDVHVAVEQYLTKNKDKVSRKAKEHVEEQYDMRLNRKPSRSVDSDVARAAKRIDRALDVLVDRHDRISIEDLSDLYLSAQDKFGKKLAKAAMREALRDRYDDLDRDAARAARRHFGVDEDLLSLLGEEDDSDIDELLGEQSLDETDDLEESEELEEPSDDVDSDEVAGNDEFPTPGKELVDAPEGESLEEEQPPEGVDGGDTATAEGEGVEGSGGSEEVEASEGSEEETEGVTEDGDVEAPSSEESGDGGEGLEPPMELVTV